MWTEPEDAGTHIRRHTFGTSGVLVSLDLAKWRCADYKPSLKFRYVEHRRRVAIPSKSAARRPAEQLICVGGLNTLNMDGPPLP